MSISPYTARVTAVEPQLFVTDLSRSLEFYYRLGFEKAFTYGEPPFYGQVKRDGIGLNLRLLERPVLIDNVRETEELLSASIIVDHVEKLFEEYSESGIDFFQRLQQEPWGARTFMIQDPDGNLLLFAS